MVVYQMIQVFPRLRERMDHRIWFDYNTKQLTWEGQTIGVVIADTCNNTMETAITVKNYEIVNRNLHPTHRHHPPGSPGWPETIQQNSEESAQRERDTVRYHLSSQGYQDTEFEDQQESNHTMDLVK